jgi:activator of HSP90 ATPase
MSTSITQKIVFKNTTPAALYDLYLNSKKHSAATGADAKLSTKVGGAFSAYEGYITGKNLHLQQDKLIVQTWRASEWESSDPDSIFIMELQAKGKNTVLHISHLNMPDSKADSIGKGWHEHYWEPWRLYLGAAAGKKK